MNAVINFDFASFNFHFVLPVLALLTLQCVFFYNQSCQYALHQRFPSYL